MKEGKRQKQVSALLLEEINRIFQKTGVEYDTRRDGFHFFSQNHTRPV